MNEASQQATEQRVQALIARWRSGYSLEQEFYSDADVFARDVERVFHQNWLLVGHVARVPRRGDFFLTQIAQTTLIIVRSADDKIHALVNLCRHRGSTLCGRSEGNAKSFACPYHAWVYDTRGELLRAKHMPDGFDPTEYRLHRAAVRVFEGLIFINLAEQPRDLGPAINDLTPYVGPHGLKDAAIAHREVFTMEANWKLAIENYLECYHCPVAHPEYAIVHDDENMDRMLEWLQLAGKLGHKVGGVGREGLAVPPTVQDYGVTRIPLREGFLTSSRDGKPLAPLMGSLADYDGGQTYMAIGPVSFGVADSDHAIILCFLPSSPTSTRVEISWLVAGDAVEGIDYQLDDLLWMWGRTIRQDLTVVKAQQQGIGSRFYEPGPYSRHEGQLERWNTWYLEQIR